MLIPLGKRIVVKKEANEDHVVVKGIYIPKSHATTSKAEVVSVGNIEGVSVGDKVLYHINAGEEYEEDGIKYLILNEPALLGVIKK